MQIDWRLKSLIFGVLSKAPQGALYAAQKYATKRAGQPISRIDPVCQWHAEAVKGCTRLLEFGAGKNLAQNLYLSSHGFRQTVVDLFPQADLDLIAAAVRDLKRLGVDLPDEPQDIASLGRFWIDYIAPLDMRATPFSDASFDCCISTNTLEHIPEGSIGAIFSELRRVIRPGGLISAQIDYSDHYAHTDRNIGFANYLRFTDSQWRWHNHANHFQNRMRHAHYGGIAAEAGFELVFEEAFDPYETWPDDARAELLTGEASDRCATGRWIWRNPKG